MWGLRGPRHISRDGSAGFLVAEFSGPYVRWVNWATTYSTHRACVLNAVGVGGDGGPATSATCGSPEGVLSDEAGGFYFSDLGTSSVRHVGADGVVWPFLGVESYNAEAAYSGDGGPASLATINGPAHMTSDCAGAVIVANRLNHNILRVYGGIVTSIAGGIDSVSGYAGDGGPATGARLNSPNGVAFDCTRSWLFIADTGNSVIRVVYSDATIDTFAGVGVPGYGGDGGLATQALLNQPRGVSVDGTGGLYIADTNNACVRRVVVNSSNLIFAHAGLCTSSGYSGDSGAATLGRLLAPSSVALDGVGGYWIADSGNNVVRHVFSASQTVTPSQTQTQSSSASQSISQSPTPTQSGTGCFKGASIASSASDWALSGSAFWAATGSPNGAPGTHYSRGRLLPAQLLSADCVRVCRNPIDARTEKHRRYDALQESALDMAGL